MDNNFRREGSTDALPIGYSLHWYELQEVIGRGGYGLTYLALDRNLQRKVAIKEYLPLDFACRDSTYTVHPITKNHKELFDWGLERFLVEARTLAKFNHPAIIRVVSVFEHNKTAYMVMEYEEGDDLAIAYMEKAPFGEQQLLNIFIPIIEGLALVHGAGFIHRDIKPSNIYLRHDGTPVLLDFGSARQTIGSRTRALTSLVTAGYAPFEQYNESEDAQGAWTDIYGLGATLYFCMTGNKPADAMERGAALLKKKRDIYQPLSQMENLPYSQAFKAAVDYALMFHAEDRPQNALEWTQKLTGHIELTPLPVVEEGDQTNTAPRETINSPDSATTFFVSGGAQQKNNASGPSSAAQRLTGESAQVIAQATSGDDEDDSTRIHYRPSHPLTNVQLSAESAAESCKESVNVLSPEPTEENKTATVEQTGVMQRAAKVDQSESPAPGKKNTAVQWLNKWWELTTAIMSSVKPWSARLNNIYGLLLHKYRKMALIGGGSFVLLITAGLLIAAFSYEDKEPGTLTAEVVETVSQKDSKAVISLNTAASVDSHESTIKQATEDLVQGLLAQAKLDIANNRILQPENNNAVYRYKTILTLQGDHPEALQGLSALIQRYRNLINAAIDEESWRQASHHIEELKLITDDPQVIKPLLARLKDYEKRLQTIAKNLEQADNYLKQNRLTRPDPANALFLYTKVLELDPDNQRANEGISVIVARLSDAMRELIKSGRISSAEKTYEKIASIDPNAPALKEAEKNFGAMVEKSKSIGNLLKTAERDFIRGKLTSPAGNNAYAKYREVLRISPGSKDALAGIDRIYAYYVSSYYQYLNEARFDKAEDVVNTLRQINYGKKQLVILRNMIQEEKAAAKNEPETIKLMLSQLEKSLKNKDISAVANLSTFENKNRQFIEKLFDKYSTYSVRVMQTGHDLKFHSAKAQVNFSNLETGESDYDREDKKEIKVDIQVSRNDDKQWTITW
ncbi:MAG: protein kinase [Gammaproteobacteria bacterium]|nr:protein kinase [Gammaproteobacteria bacterium]